MVFEMSGFQVCELRGVLAVSLCCLIILAGAQTTDPSEVTALQAIKKRLVDPLKHLDTWNEGDPCTSNWTGVLCFNMTGNDGYLHIRELQLLNMNLSGSLSPELGRLSHMKILDMMWNKISGSIPKEIGNLISLELLLLNGNQLSGSLPEEIGNLSNLDRLQIDENHLSGSLPKSLANLNKTRHFHLNNNSITGQIPPELSRLPHLVHFLLDNNNLSGYLPPEFSSLPNLLILQLDNNHFDEGGIPASYSNMSKLLKLSLRNCSLRGLIPDLSRIQHLGYLDLSRNQLSGPIPSKKLSNNITTIDISNNNLNGSIPSNFSDLPLLQRLSLENNMLSGSVPSTIWQNVTFVATEKLILDFQNNMLSNIMDGPHPHENVTLRLQGNPLCTNIGQLNITQFCVGGEETTGSPTTSTIVCYTQSCPTEYFYEYVPVSPEQCFCAAPIRVDYRLKSPGFSDFIPYMDQFRMYQTSGLGLDLSQLSIDSFVWEEGPRLRMHLKFFPLFDNHTSTFNVSEILRIRDMFTGWTTPPSSIFGPHELLNFILLGPYSNVILEPSKSEISKGALAGIVLGSIVSAVIIFSLISILLMRRCTRYNRETSKKHLLPNTPIKIDGLKGFTFREMALATNNFNRSNQVGHGGYGKVYKGMLADGTVVAIKRTGEGSLQGGKEFLTEIELLSRVHHRNLVSLVGYCEEEGEQMLVYEFMSNGTLRDHISAKSKGTLSFSMRLHIAFDSARGILYLHTEANPPIYHRDIKATNILLDSKFTAKVADFGLSRVAPVSGLDGVLPCPVITAVKGTPGYLDPEYFLTDKLTDKSDVYSLGVVFLELLTGMPPTAHGKNIVREVNAAYESGMIFSMIDGRMGSYPSECVERFLRLALRCSKDKADLRPSIPEVVKELEHILRMTPKTTNHTPPESTTGDSSSVMEMPSSASATENFFSSHMSDSVVSTIVPR